MDVAEGEFAVVACREKGEGEQPDIECRNNCHDRQPGNGAEGGTVDGLAKRADKADPDASGLKARGRYLEDPGQQQDQEEIEVISPQATRCDSRNFGARRPSPTMSSQSEAKSGCGEKICAK
jgi:hypothetical protein